MNQDLTIDLDNFYDQSDTDQLKTLDKILEFANSAPEEFIKIIKNEKFDGLNNLAIFYEALSEDLDNWADFFLLEIGRLFETAKLTNSPNLVLSHLNEFSFIEPQDFKHRNAVVEISKKEMDNKNPTFRYYAINLLMDFVKETDYLTIMKLKEHLKDPNWRIRYCTYLSLKDLNRFENTDELSWFDKIRAKLFDTTNFK